MEFISICFFSFLFLLIFRVITFWGGLNLLIYDITYFFEWELFSLNRRLVVYIFLIDWIRLIFISFVLFISALVIFYRKDYIAEDKNINRFILLVLLFVFSIILLINPISPTKFKEGGAAIFLEHNKNHHIAILGKKFNIPLLIINLRLPNRS